MQEMASRLPVLDFEDEILRSIDENQVTIVTAETGAGKSTQVPQMLLRYGYQVVVTEPRRLAARSVAKRVAEEYGCELGGVIGYRTGFERCDSPETECLFATDGLELVREIHSNQRPDVLVIDEVHEWNIHIETLVAWSKKRLAEDPSFKLVIMSATLESGRLSEYFGEASVIEVPGRLFPVNVQSPQHGSIENEVYELVRQGRNVLVFQPGKGEIAETIEKLRDMKTNAEIMPLHGELEPAQQDKVFLRYGRPKVVVATNVAQTSITISDIDAVVDSGLERRIETIDGIERLCLRRTAVADDIQRRGRAGRCREGIYVSCYDGMDEQRQFPLAEIQRVRLDQLVLRLAIQGFDATDLEFFHQPDRLALLEAKRALHVLGAINEDEQVMAIGREMALLPISVQNARMVIEARKLEVLDDVLTIVACLEVNGIASRNKDDQWLWKSLTQETQSDLLAMLDVFNAARKMHGSDDLAKNGIHPKSFFRALELRKKLGEVLTNQARQSRGWVNFDSCGDRKKIVQACVAGMVDHLYQVFGEQCSNGDSQARKFNDRSVVASWSASWIVGLPLDIDIKNKYGGSPYTLRLVTMATVVDPEMLVQVAPHLMRVEKKNLRYLIDEHLMAYDIVKMFNGVELPGAEEVKFTWAELPQHLADGVDLEKLLQEMISDQFERAKWYGGVLHGELITDPENFSLDHTPVAFGYNPSDDSKLVAYPAVVKFSIGGWRIDYFLTLAEAQTAEREFNGVYGSDSEFSRQLVQVAVDVPEIEESSVAEWQYREKGNWVCPNGHGTRAFKRATEVICDVCGAIHQIPAEHVR